MAQRLALNAVLVDPDEVQVVGKDDVLRQGLVASDLVGSQDLIEIFADALILDVSDNEPPFLTLKSGAPLSTTRLGSCWTEIPVALASAIACKRA